jgi:hypothetical protein
MVKSLVDPNAREVSLECKNESVFLYRCTERPPLLSESKAVTQEIGGA